MHKILNKNSETQNFKLEGILQHNWCFRKFISTANIRSTRHINPTNKQYKILTTSPISIFTTYYLHVPGLIPDTELTTSTKTVGLH